MIRTTLADCIRAYLGEAEESEMSKFARMVSIAKRGLRDLNMDISGAPVATVLDIDLNLMTAPLPLDYITYKRIGMCINGRMHPLGYNPDLCKDLMFDDCGNIEGHGQQQGGAFFPQPLHVRNGEQLGAYFGLGGGNSAYGYYMINEAHGEIQFSSLLHGHENEVVLEYLTDIKKVGSDYPVHPYQVQALVAWCAWRDIENRRGVSSSEKERKKTEYYRERRNCARRYTSFTLDEAYQYSRLANKQSPKF